MSRRGHHTVFKSFRVFLHANVAHTSRPLRTKPRCRLLSTGASTNTPTSTKRPSANPWILYPAIGLLLGGAAYVAYENYQPLRHTSLAVVRCSRIARMCISCFMSVADRRHEWFTVPSIWLNIYIFRCRNRRSHRLQVYACSQLPVRGGKAARVFRVSYA
ncbi:hypothetical protein J3R83DRAFT_3442 [Lanmaoa asiatica]|nr:hypothetical protein J3R83DRAFT_3442 [Lanmaoa asiatica]